MYAETIQADTVCKGAYLEGTEMADKLYVNDVEQM